MKRSLISFCITEISPPSKASIFLRAKSFLPYSLRKRFVYIYEALLNVYKKRRSIGLLVLYKCISTNINFVKSIVVKHFIHVIEHNINMHLNCFVYSKLCQSNLALLIYTNLCKSDICHITIFVK